jgi:hypothetical protein
MAVGFPTKANWAAGDVLTASALDDLAGTVNLTQYMKPWNTCLNSNMSVWQRGTSVAVPASNTSAYTADRWAISTTANGASTVARYATGDTTNLPNIQYCARVQRNSGQTGTTGQFFYQSWETVNSIPYAGKTVVVSFYARAGASYLSSSTNSTFKLWSGTGTDQNLLTSFTGQTLVAASSPTLTASWVRYSFSGTISASATQIAFGFDMGAVGTAGASDYVEITGVQIEQGSVANTYQPNQSTYQGELAACQRYYFRISSGVAYGALTTVAWQQTSTVTESNLQFPVTMRIPPTSVDYPAYSNISFLNYGGGAYPLTGSITIETNQTTTNFAKIYAGNTIGAVVGVVGNWCGNSSGYLGMSAEL